ncbi:hypothetical protein FHR83_009067 [Actinoplanes campanulatus]|uniref:Uncharacterized protein n=1 Tax=Actinoplanes campanulatus TaxID=113559 RepID=A0A7W5ASR9_9ACTN|nr:hypothetical protein [Actinoplanes campanulatus]MBB3101339.1 hypothetical protein [Actinoplanes campanulatus]GGN48426.1 hypothetical protein GCM10010109_85550 [Actinoplanes campanulatus]GID41728.1 hypothetical protein Aca09nite_82340 [Actinoplanes campanulatus]
MTFPSGDPWGAPAPSPEPESPAVPEATGPVIVEIAEIHVTSSLVRTPVGDLPLAGSRWHVTDHWLSQRRTPMWAKVAAFLAICPTGGLSLLLLLVKETVPQGTVHVTVTSGTHQYVGRVPVQREGDVASINQQVNYVRSLAAL